MVIHEGLVMILLRVGTYAKVVTTYQILLDFKEIGNYVMMLLRVGTYVKVVTTYQILLDFKEIGSYVMMLLLVGKSS